MGFEKENDKKEKIDTDTGNVDDTMNQEKVGLLIKEVKIETDEGTKRIKENDRSLEDDTFSINEDKSTMDSIRQLGSQTKIGKENGNHEEMLDSGSIIPKEISSQDGEFEGQKIVEVIAKEMDQSVNITDNNNIKFEPNKENESLFKDTFANEVIAEKTIQSVNITDNNNSKFEENKENNGLQLGIFEKEKDKKEKIDTDTGNVADTTNQEKVGLLIKE